MMMMIGLDGLDVILVDSNREEALPVFLFCLLENPLSIVLSVVLGVWCLLLYVALSLYCCYSSATKDLATVLSCSSGGWLVNDVVCICE